MTRIKMNACPDPDTWPKWFYHNDKSHCSALAPIFDMINHQFGVTDFSWKYEDGVLFYSKEKIKAGDELFLTYLDATTLVFLMVYGFTEKEMLSPMRFTIPELRLGKFYKICNSNKMGRK